MRLYIIKKNNRLYNVYYNEQAKKIFNIIRHNLFINKKKKSNTITFGIFIFYYSQLVLNCVLIATNVRANIVCRRKLKKNFHRWCPVQTQWWTKKAQYWFPRDETKKKKNRIMGNEMFWVTIEMEKCPGINEPNRRSRGISAVIREIPKSTIL